jgi:hypothetical protein
VEDPLSKGERQRLAGLAATANNLLVLFVLAVALPLLPAKLADPFWLLAFTGAFCTNGFLALLAVLLLHMAAALQPQSMWHQARRLLVRRCSRSLSHISTGTATLPPRFLGVSSESCSLPGPDQPL